MILLPINSVNYNPVVPPDADCNSAYSLLLTALLHIHEHTSSIHYPQQASTVAIKPVVIELRRS